MKILRTPHKDSHYCRSMLERHKLDYARLWMTKTPEAFNFVENNSFQIKTL